MAAVAVGGRRNRPLLAFGTSLCLRSTLLTARRAIAIEDSAAGVQSAARAGVTAVGTVAFVTAEERPRRTLELMDAGAVGVTPTWAALVDKLLPAACLC
jgi:beta-phosphoglucomutase-like phosphatase (HAD superfamily)